MRGVRFGRSEIPSRVLPGNIPTSYPTASGEDDLRIDVRKNPKLPADPSAIQGIANEAPMSPSEPHGGDRDIQEKLVSGAVPGTNLETNEPSEGPGWELFPDSAGAVVEPAAPKSEISWRLETSAPEASTYDSKADGPQIADSDIAAPYGGYDSTGGNDLAGNNTPGIVNPTAPVGLTFSSLGEDGRRLRSESLDLYPSEPQAAVDPVTAMEDGPVEVEAARSSPTSESETVGDRESENERRVVSSTFPQGSAASKLADAEQGTQRGERPTDTAAGAAFPSPLASAAFANTWGNVSGNDLGKRVEDRTGRRGRIFQFRKGGMAARDEAGQAFAIWQKDARLVDAASAPNERRAVAQDSAISADGFPTPTEPLPVPRGAVRAYSAREMADMAQRALERHRRLFEALGVSRLVQRWDKPFALMANERGLFINPAELAEQSERFAEDGQSVEQWMDEAMKEEWLHLVQIEAEARLGRNWRETYAAIWNDPHLDPRLKEGAARAYEDFDSLSDAQRGAEVMRMALSGKWRGTITERIYQAIADFIDFLKSFDPEAQKSDLFRDSYRRCQAVMREVYDGRRGIGNGTNSQTHDPGTGVAGITSGKKLGNKGAKSAIPPKKSKRVYAQLSPTTVRGKQATSRTLLGFRISKGFYDYLREIEHITGRAFRGRQLSNLLYHALRKAFFRMDKEALRVHTAQFTQKLKDSLIDEWEKIPNRLGRDTQQMCTTKLENCFA